MRQEKKRPFLLRLWVLKSLVGLGVLTVVFGIYQAVNILPVLHEKRARLRDVRPSSRRGDARPSVAGAVEKLRSLPGVSNVSDDGAGVTVVVMDELWYGATVSQRQMLADRFLDVLWGFGNPQRVLWIVDGRGRTVAEEALKPLGIGKIRTGSMTLVGTSLYP